MAECDSPQKKRHKSGGNTKTVDQRYKDNYHKEFPVIMRSTKSVSHALCTLCNSHFSVAHGGLNDVKKHIKTISHKELTKTTSENRTISSMFVDRTSTDNVTKAEVLFTNFLVEHNIPIAAADHTRPLFKAMFPDSTIASKLRMVWGSMSAVERQVDVPHLTPGDQGPVSVELIAPTTPGRYQSHWKMQYSGTNFGHRVWCAVIVETKEILEPIAEDNLKVVQHDQGHDGVEMDGDLSASVPMIALVSSIPLIDNVPAVSLLPSTSIGETVSSTSLADSLPMIPLMSATPVLDTVLMAPLFAATPVPDQPDKVVDKIEEKLASVSAVVTQLQRDNSPRLSPPTDLLSFEMVDADNKEVANVIQTTTPNNTPAVLTPPSKSPVLGVLSNSSSVEIVGEEESSPEMVEYIKEKMAALTFNSDMSYELESVSSSTDDDEDDDETSSSDGDFFIVPLPDCFQPDKPLSACVVPSPWDENDNLTDVRSVDEIVSVSSLMDGTRPEIDVEETVSQTEEVKLLNSQTRPICEPEESGNKMEEYVNKVEESGNKMEESGNKMEESGNQVEESGNQVEESGNTVEESGNTVEESMNKVETGTDDSTAEQTGSNGNTDQQAKAGEFANQLMNTAVTAATRAASQAYSTAKEVFYTWQAKHNTWTPPADTFTPPKSTWTPPEDNWTPPENKWTPPENNWTPPENNWTPSENNWTPPDNNCAPQSESVESDVSPEPAQRLVEMGFYDMTLNAELLSRFDGDLEMVVQELLQQSDNNWATQRH